MMRLFSYKLTTDSGFAPNPFYGVLTLATCKPSMRRDKKKGDWIAGFTSKTLCCDPVGKERLIYLMQVEHTIAIADYFRSSEYENKIPTMASLETIRQAGDNIYCPTEPYPSEASHFKQLLNRGGHKEEDRTHDINGKNVLIAYRYAYFGNKALEIPDDLRPEIPKGQHPHGCRTKDDNRASKFVEFVFAKANGIKVSCHPHKWPPGDESWREKS